MHAAVVRPHYGAHYIGLRNSHSTNETHLYKIYATVPIPWLKACRRLRVSFICLAATLREIVTIEQKRQRIGCEMCATIGQRRAEPKQAYSLNETTNTNNCTDKSERDKDRGIEGRREESKESD